MGYSETIGKASQLDQITTANAQSNAYAAAYLKQLLSVKNASVAKAEDDAKLQAVHENALGTGYQAGESAALSKIWKAMEARRIA